MDYTAFGPLPAPQPPRPNIGTVNEGTERYVRVNVTKNTKGYNFDFTVSITTNQDHKYIEDELHDLMLLAQEGVESHIKNQEIMEYETKIEHGS